MAKVDNILIKPCTCQNDTCPCNGICMKKRKFAFILFGARYELCEACTKELKEKYGLAVRPLVLSKQV